MFSLKGGDEYVGQWSNNLKNGKGVLRKANGDKIEATWKDD